MKLNGPGRWSNLLNKSFFNDNVPKQWPIIFTGKSQLIKHNLSLLVKLFFTFE